MIKNSHKEEAELVPTKRYILTMVVYAPSIDLVSRTPGTIVKIDLDEPVTHNRPIGYGAVNTL